MKVFFKYAMFGVIGFATATNGLTLGTWGFWVIIIAAATASTLSEIIGYEECAKKIIGAMNVYSEECGCGCCESDSEVSEDIQKD